MYRNAKPIFFVLIGFLLFTGCDKDNNVIPNVPVDIYINTDDPQFTNLLPIGGWEYVTGGSRGIVVYRKSIDEFKAFDRHSTYEPVNGCKVWVDPSNFYLEDECSDSRFQIIDGFVETGPAVRPLKEYNTSFAGNILHIFNF